MEYILLALLLIVLVLLLMLLLRPQQQIDTQVIADSVSKDQSQLRQEINSNLMSQIGTLSQTLNAAQESASKAQRENLKDISNHFQQLRQEVTENLENVRKSVDDRLRDIQQSVDEKLQKTLEDKMTNSFKMVSERLEQVYKGLGEMQHIASSVGDLKKVLSNTKTRGIVGEIQLDAILQEILTPDQYDKEVATRPSMRNFLAKPTRLCRMLTWAATRLRSIWLTRTWKFLSSNRPRVYAKSTWNRLTPPILPSCFCLSKACMPKW